MDILQDADGWVGETEWMPLEARNDAVNRLLDSRLIDLDGLLRRMADDFVLCCRLLFTTHDPRTKQGLIPFRLWKFKPPIKGSLSQEEVARVVLECVKNQQPLLIEKSRDMGVTWIELCVFLHCWLFWDDFHALLTSRKKDLIDSRREPDTLFERLRIVVDHMPKRWRELLLPGWNEATCAPLMRLLNPVNRNTITGEPPVRDFGRQGRYSAILYDEAASIAELKEMVASAGYSSECHIYSSTPKGMNPEFYRIKNSGKIKVLTFHWTSHPIKAKGLYLGERATEHSIAKVS